MPADLCDLEKKGYESVPHAGYTGQMLSKQAVLLTN